MDREDLNTIREEIVKQDAVRIERRRKWTLKNSQRHDFVAGDKVYVTLNESERQRLGNKRIRWRTHWDPQTILEVRDNSLVLEGVIPGRKSQIVSVNQVRKAPVFLALERTHTRHHPAAAGGPGG